MVGLVNTRGGNVGQPTDRGRPVSRLGATRPMAMIRLSINGSHQGQRSCTAHIGRTHDRRCRHTGQSGERARIAVCGAKEDSNTEFAEKQSHREPPRILPRRFAQSALRFLGGSRWLRFSANSVKNLAFVPAHRCWPVHPIAQREDRIGSPPQPASSRQRERIARRSAGNEVPREAC